MREIAGTIRAFPTERESQTATLIGLPSRRGGATPGVFAAG
jgi:hypothetical protein